MGIVRAIHKLGKWLDKLGEYICLVMLFAMVVITGAQIICRVFFEALSWSEELARYLLVWSSIIGAACVYRRAGHINVSIIQDLLPSKGKMIMQIIVHILCGVFFALMIYFGFIYMGKMANQLSPAMRLPMSIMYASIPVGGILLLYQAIDGILALLFDKEEPETEIKEAEQA